LKHWRLHPVISTKQDAKLQPQTTFPTEPRTRKAATASSYTFETKCRRSPSSITSRGSIVCNFVQRFLFANKNEITSFVVVPHSISSNRQAFPKHTHHRYDSVIYLLSPPGCLLDHPRSPG
jgi:hypothetical protein